ncbi:MAG TPA: maltotransferase domain-containing protein, partial [Lentzea sp.]
MSGRLGIDDVSPVVSAGRYPAKAVVGEHIPVEATVWREGHDKLAATVTWRGPNDRVARQTRMHEVGIGLDRWGATVVPDAEGAWTFRIDAWSDPWGTWNHAVEVKIAAGQGPGDLANDLEIGALLLDRVARRPDRRQERALLMSAAEALRDEDRPLNERVAPALADDVQKIMFEHPVRELITKGKTHKIWCDRRKAAFGSWYEFFPRSTGGIDETGQAVHGTFATATKELDRVAAMGFDVVYFPPIHPIGRVNRKGPNNTLVAGPEDVGSPWAIGADEGGHDAIAPELGTIEDFDALVQRAHELGLEVALDFALQCAPDHPWVLKHPEWFTTRPDGTIAYAENPPKRYQDIYPLNFDNDPEGIYAEALRIVRHWIGHGVKIFRVDNPHTKPFPFWDWTIAEVHARHPDAIFLSEAFTRPKVMRRLAKGGFSQSYTYFTWRNSGPEIIDYLEELSGPAAAYMRPNFFTNTPD